MRGLWLGPDGPRNRDDLPRAGRPGEARIRLSVGGVCATDLELVKGYMGFTGVLGHEWVGVVEDAPDAAWIGRRVVGEINCPCGSCPTCGAGHPTHCPRRTVLGILGRDGAFAEQLWLPVGNLRSVPDSVPDDCAVFVEPLAAALRIAEQIHVRPTYQVVVLGLGRLGQLCARVLALTGAEVIAVSRRPEPLALLPPGIRRGGAPEPIADVVVDTTGASGGLALAKGWVRAGGTIVLKTTTHDVGDVTPTAWVIDEITVIGSRCGAFDPALRLLASGAVDPRPLITARFPLERGVEALAAARLKGALKVLLTP